MTKKISEAQKARIRGMRNQMTVKEISQVTGFSMVTVCKVVKGIRDKAPPGKKSKKPEKVKAGFFDYNKAWI
jgi:hypothetical protein